MLRSIFLLSLSATCHGYLVCKTGTLIYNSWCGNIEYSSKLTIQSSQLNSLKVKKRSQNKLSTLLYMNSNYADDDDLKPATSSSSSISVSLTSQPAVAEIDTTKYSSIQQSSLNLLKNCVGAGAFSVSARVASISTDPSTVLMASGLIIFMALWASYNFYMVGETCRLTGKLGNNLWIQLFYTYFYRFDRYLLITAY